MNTSVRLIAAFALLTVTFSVSATSWQDNSHYVALGPRTGYYIVRPGSSLSDQLGIDGAPTVDTADPFNHGYGADALAFRFSRASILSAPRLISCKRHRTNSTPSGSVRSFAGRAGCRTWKDFLANPRASNDGPTFLSPITRSRFTTRLKISVAEESDAAGRRASTRARITMW